MVVRRTVHAVAAFAPWIAPVALLLWGWGARDLLHQLPAYGDTLEALWGIKWYGDRLLAGQDVGFFSGIFHPMGWQVGTFAHSPVLLILLIPLYKLGGAAFAFNLGTLAAFLLGYVGMFFLARSMGFERLLSTSVAILFAFCYMRWLRVGGHLNQLIGSSLIPWLLWSMERAWSNREKLLRWYALAGVIWGVAAAISFYFVWLGAIAVFGYVLARIFAERKVWQRASAGALLAAVIMLALSGPVLASYYRAVQVADVAATEIAWVSEWGASLNSLPAPPPNHSISWLRQLNRLIYRGPLSEASVVTLGVVASLLSLFGLWQSRRDRKWAPVLAVTALGLLFALGYVLRWNGKPVDAPLFAQLNAFIWKVGQTLKPDLFSAPGPYGPYVQGAPLPGFLLAAVVPFWEGARTLSRFAFIALPGFYLLVGRGVQGFRRPLLQVALSALLLVEFLPHPTPGFTADPAPHPAFEWLQANTQPGEGIVDLTPAGGERLEPMFSGEVLWATQYHQRPTAAGAGSIWPQRTYDLRTWFFLHPYPWQDAELAQVLRDNRIEHILLHMKGPAAGAASEALQASSSVWLIGCFDRSKARTAWPYEICVFRLREG